MGGEFKWEIQRNVRMYQAKLFEANVSANRKIVFNLTFLNNFFFFVAIITYYSFFLSFLSSIISIISIATSIAKGINITK